MPQQPNASARTLAQELKLIRKAVARIQRHPVSPARYIALLSAKTACEAALTSIAREEFSGRKEAA